MVKTHHVYISSIEIPSIPIAVFPPFQIPGRIFFHTNTRLQTHSLGIQSPCQMMIGMYNHLLRKVFRFHYHSQKVIGFLGIPKKISWFPFQIFLSKKSNDGITTRNFPCHPATEQTAGERWQNPSEFAPTSHHSPNHLWWATFWKCQESCWSTGFCWVI